MAATAPAHADIIDDLEPGHWVEVPSSAMRDVCPPDTADYDFHFHCAGVTNAWGGATLDTTRGRLILWGGGHADYKGNELYAFDTHGLSWERIWGPTPENQIPSGGTHETYDDGNPGSRHTYSGLSYVPAPVDAFLSMGGSLWQSGNYSVATWSFSFQDGTWTRKADGPAGGGGYGDPSAYDPQTGHVFRRSNDRMVEYDPVGDAFTDRAQSDGGFWQSNVAAALDPVGRLMVFVGDDRLDLYHLDSDAYEQDVTLNGASVDQVFSVPPGIGFDTTQERFVLWGGGLDVYTFDPDTLTLSVHTGAGDDPGQVTTSGGVFGRFRYVPSRNAFFRVNTVDENVFAFRLGPGTGTPLPGEGGGSGTAGAGGTGGSGGSGTTGGSGGAGANAAAPTTDDEGGCGCRIPQRPTHPPIVWVLLVVAAFAFRRRR
jgi:MYXO-CTERM domain-containing protein